MENTQIVVSINCLVYNHEKYLRQCLDSFLMQKTTFPYEVLVHDDASTDNSAKIIREYEMKYPDIIKPIYQKENQYKTRIGINGTYQYPRAKGKYIAHCEGDDYWIDPLKLQKQVDFMEDHPFCTASYGKNLVVNGRDGSFIRENSCKVNDFLSMEECFLPDFPPHISTGMFRKEVLLNIPEFFKEAAVGDLTTLHWAGICGSVYCFEDIFSCYRYQTNGSWTSRMNNKEMKHIHNSRMIIFYTKLDEYTDMKYHEYIRANIEYYKIEEIQKRRQLKALLQNKYFRHSKKKEKTMMLAEIICPHILEKYRKYKTGKLVDQA